MRRILMASFLVGAVFITFGLVKENLAQKTISVATPESDNVEIVNDWFPTLENDNAFETTITARAAILVNYDTGEVLYAKNPQEKMPAASTVKIMTALVALENADLSEVYAVSKKSAEIGEDSMGLVEGEKATLSDLLYGLLLPSGNDAAVAIAEGVSGDEDEFVALMNKKSKALGLSDTKFVNASGLDVDFEQQYSSAFDLATMTRFALETQPQFRKAVSTDYKLIEANSNHKAFELFNDTNLLTTYPGAAGVKPGFTWEAGYCLVTYAENEGVRLIGVLLNSLDRRAEMTELLDLGFKKYGIAIEHPDLDLL